MLFITALLVTSCKEKVAPLGYQESGHVSDHASEQSLDQAGWCRDVDQGPEYISSSDA